MRRRCCFSDEQVIEKRSLLSPPRGAPAGAPGRKPLRRLPAPLASAPSLAAAGGVAGQRPRGVGGGGAAPSRTQLVGSAGRLPSACWRRASGGPTPAPSLLPASCGRRRRLLPSLRRGSGRGSGLRCPGAGWQRIWPPALFWMVVVGRGCGSGIPCPDPVDGDGRRWQGWPAALSRWW